MSSRRFGEHFGDVAPSMMAQGGKKRKPHHSGDVVPSVEELLAQQQELSAGPSPDTPHLPGGEHSHTEHYLEDPLSTASQSDDDHSSLSTTVSDASTIDSVTGKGHRGHGAANAVTRLIPVVVGAISTVVLLFFILFGAGEVQSDGKPKAILFVFGGLKGTAFNDFVNGGSDDDATAAPFAPNLQALMSGANGAYAKCANVIDARCARTQSGADLGSGYTWGSAPGLASILTGVLPTKHGVKNDNTATAFSSASQQYPSMAALVKRSGLRTAAIGTAPLLQCGNNSTAGLVGVLDAECGGVKTSIKACGESQQTCNLDDKVAVKTNKEKFRGVDIDSVGFQLAALLGAELEGEQHKTPADLVIVHMNNLDIVATDTADTEGSFSAQSTAYAAQMFLADSLVGVAAAVLEERSHIHKENWLVVGTSDHGGHGKTPAGTHQNDDEVVPFFAATITGGAAPVQLQQPAPPTTQLDVVPTILQWLDLLGEPTTSAEHGATDEQQAAQKYSPTMFDGRVQSICSSGKRPQNCTAPISSSPSGEM